MNTALSVRRIGAHELPLPAQMTAGAAGFDLRSTETYILQPGERHCFPTGFAWDIPDEFMGQIWPRSGLAVKHGIDTLAGMIDSDYTGEIIVALINHGDQPFEVKVGDRIAQIVLTLFVRCSLVERTSLKETERGDGGFSSTGIA